MSTAKKPATAKGRSKMPAKRDDYGAPIGPWFDEQAPAKRPALDALRGVVEATVPTAEAGLKWGTPFWSIDDAILCNLGVLKREVALGIYAAPDVFDDPAGLLSGTSKEYRVLKVKDGDAVDEASVARWLRAAVAARG